MAGLSTGQAMPKAAGVSTILSAAWARWAKVGRLPASSRWMRPSREPPCGPLPSKGPHLLPGAALGPPRLAPLHLMGVRTLKPHYLTRLDVSVCGVAVCQHLN